MNLFKSNMASVSPASDCAALRHLLKSLALVLIAAHVCSARGAAAYQRLFVDGQPGPSSTYYFPRQDFGYPWSATYVMTPGSTWGIPDSTGGICFAAAYANGNGLYKSQSDGAPAVFLSFKGATAKINGIRLISFNSKDQAAFTGASPTNPYLALWLVDATGRLTQIAGYNDSAANGDQYGDLAAIALNDAGQVAFIAKGKTGKGAGVYLYDGSTVHPIANSGSAAPTGGVFTKFSSVVVNNSGLVTFNATSTLSNGLAVAANYLYDKASLVVLSSASIPICFNDAGQLLVNEAVAGGLEIQTATSTVPVVQGPANASTPDPSTQPVTATMNNAGHVAILTATQLILWTPQGAHPLANVPAGSGGQIALNSSDQIVLVNTDANKKPQLQFWNGSALLTVLPGGTDFLDGYKGFQTLGLGLANTSPLASQSALNDEGDVEFGVNFSGPFGYVWGLCVAKCPH